MKPVTNKGITLIEMIVVIVVLGIAIPPLLTMWANVSWRSSRSEALADASFYAQELMEEVKTKRFDENTTSPWNTALGINPTTKGLDTVNNETAVNKTNWDDVDDFNGYLDTPATGYNRSVTVNYANLTGTSWQTCNPTSCVAASNCTNCNECCYKHIAVSVSRANAAYNVTLVTIVSAH